MKAFTIDADGVREVEAPADLVEKTEKAAQKKADVERERTAAQERLQRARKQRGALIQQVEIDGEAWWVKLLDFVELSRAALIINRDPDGTIRLLDNDVMRSLIVAALHCGVATAEEDATPYFSLQDAEDYANEPTLKNLVAALFNKVTDLNPELLPKKA